MVRLISSNVLGASWYEPKIAHELLENQLEATAATDSQKNSTKLAPGYIIHYS